MAKEWKQGGGIESEVTCASDDMVLLPIVEKEPNRSGMVRVRGKVASQMDGKLSSGGR